MLAHWIKPQVKEVSHNQHSNFKPAWFFSYYLMVMIVPTSKILMMALECSHTKILMLALGTFSNDRKSSTKPTLVTQRQIKAPSTTSWTSADKVENKFGSNPLYPHQNQTDPHYTGGLNAMRQAQCYHQRLWIAKKYAVTNTETDLGMICLYFHHWLQHQRTNKYSVRLNTKVGKTSLFKQLQWYSRVPL